MRELNISENSALSEEMGLLEYKRTRESYLVLCRRYSLNPFDLDILGLSVSSLPKKDKLNLVQLMLKIIRFEKNNKNLVGHGLFPLTVQESERSGYLVPVKRAS